MHEQVILMLENPGQFKGFIDSQREWDLFIEKIKNLRTDLNELGSLLLRQRGEPTSYLY